jgi:Protein of unknown function (DUF3540)
MSNVARWPIEQPANPDLYLGPAEVVRARPTEVEVALPRGGHVQARLALAYAYEPLPGDDVLVIGNEEGHWIIGVLRGKGPSVLRFPADAELRAEGTLRIAADRGVEITSPELAVTAKKIRMVASEVVHAFTTLRQRIQELLSVHAGQAHTVVAGSMHSQSKNATILTEEKVSINGKEVHLG